MAMTRATREHREFAFDGLVGPTHHYAGLSTGNLASERHRGKLGNPRAAALQGLAKMRKVRELGAGQALLPPHERPHLGFLRSLGFGGSDADVLEAAYRSDPWLLSVASSASSMWAANAATVTPSSDSSDARLHLTPANLCSMLHRSLEAPSTTRILRKLFADAARFCVHDPLPAHPSLGDEGAANHTRLATSSASLHLFGWGHAEPGDRRPQRFPARQARAASEAVARRHLLRAERALFWQQHPSGIDAGAFHSDVLAVGSGTFFMLHELGFVEPLRLVEELRARLGDELTVVTVGDEELPVADAVACYPFNCELLPLPSGGLSLLAPSESEDNLRVRAFLERVRAEANAVVDVIYVDVNDSMRNGGGPACLRLRIPLTADEQQRVAGRVFFDAELDQALVTWVERNYRDRLSIEDLRDPTLLDASRRALDELTGLLELGPIYDFQR
jgi:succinylarginine dihydrolase